MEKQVKPGWVLAGRVAILGSGREGLAAYDYLRALGVSDSLDVITEGRAASPKELELEARGELRVCSLDQARLENLDVLVRSPGISIYRECIRRAAAAGVRITTPSSIWFQAHPDARTIVITGTKGKSTTATLLTHLLGHAGLRVRLAGNIGTPLLACDDRDVDWWVIELSSFQLADLEARPTIGVLLNLATDHLDWHGDEEHYRSDKLRLADLLAGRDLLANRSDPVLYRALEGRPDIAWFDASLADGIAMPASLPGRHNRANLAACLAVLDKLGIDRGQPMEALPSFEGLPHRLRSLGTAGGVEYIDDSISTAPVATVAALEALQGRKVVLLAGGLDRGIDWTPSAHAIRAHPPVALVALPDNGPRIAAALAAAGVRLPRGIFTATDLADAVMIARRVAEAGEVVVLSPGAPSFPYFRDYEDRGLQFARLCGFG